MEVQTMPPLNTEGSCSSLLTVAVEYYTTFSLEHFQQT